MEKTRQILALTKRQLIAVRRLSGDGLALSVIACAMPPLPKGEAFASRKEGKDADRELFCAFLLKKLPEDTFYWTFILLYSCQNKKT